MKKIIIILLTIFSPTNQHTYIKLLRRNHDNDDRQCCPVLLSLSYWMLYSKKTHKGYMLHIYVGI